MQNSIPGNIRVGDVSPDFELTTFEPSENRFGVFKLSHSISKKKWTVLFFYPADYTFVCPTELSDLGDYYMEIKELGVEVISVSTDTQFVHMAWQREEKLLQNIKFPMAADPTGKVSRLFGIYDENTGLALRGTFLLNPEGKLVGSEINSYSVGRSAAELTRKLEAYVYVHHNPDEVCPANWDVGRKTIRPAKTEVGRVHEALA
ncbi:MAG: peroxiredoxin [Elusimicrobia bacterium]|nr:peroxiredoxin [Candidatus Obscuribacterium magneticum]